MALPQVLSSARLWLSAVRLPAPPMWQSPPVPLLAMMEFFRVSSPKLPIPPPSSDEAGIAGEGSVGHCGANSTTSVINATTNACRVVVEKCTVADVHGNVVINCATAAATVASKGAVCHCEHGSVAIVDSPTGITRTIIREGAVRDR